MNAVDLVLKFVLAGVWIFQQTIYVSIKYKNMLTTLIKIFTQEDVPINATVWSVCCVLANLGICLLGLWRCFANNYLHWAAVCTWLLLNLQGLVNES